MSGPRDLMLDSDHPDLGVDMTGFFRATSISFVVADPNRPDTPIVYVNRAFELTTGYSHRFVVGRNCRFLQGPDTDPQAVKNIAIALSRNDGVRQKILNYRADGSTFINDLVITPIKDADGEVAYFVGVQREIASSEQDEDNALRQKTIDIIRQQVQIHLSVVMEMSRIHAENSEDDGPVDFISLLRRLEILDLLYENLNETSLREELLDVGAYVSQIAAKLVAKSPRPGVRINISTEPAVVPLDIAVRLGVVLAELLEASLSTSFEGMDSGHLDVTLRNEGESVELSVFDDGHGDPSAAQWLASGDLTLRVIRKLLSDMNANILAPDVDHGREINVSVPITPTVSS
ncbi:PAS domain-containing protein [uncultured Algimonas sp.]|uniref:PAS domain-containing protein n=1 Tax=uncultured Algimonas sp. TaxID=1547920 RepID=UPI002622230D|nr:PAS domain-containing protein [uncultured Algimonas sp.]